MDERMNLSPREALLIASLRTIAHGVAFSVAGMEEDRAQQTIAQEVDALRRILAGESSGLEKVADGAAKAVLAHINRFKASGGGKEARHA